MIPTREIPAQVRLLRGHRRSGAVVSGTPPTHQPPHAEAGGPYTATVGVATQVSRAGSYSPNGDWSAMWHWGDGSTSGPYPGNAGAPPTGADASHIWTSPGTYTIRLVAADAYGSAEDTAQVVVSPAAATLDSLDVTPDPISLVVGASAAVRVRGYDASMVEIPNVNADWHTTNGVVAQIPPGPAVTNSVQALAAGSASIWASVGAIESNRVVVTVSPLPTGRYPHLSFTPDATAEFDPTATVPPNDTEIIGPNATYGIKSGSFYRSDGGNGSTVEDNGWPGLPGYAYDHRYPVATPEGGGTGLWRLEDAATPHTYRRMYTCDYFKLHPNQEASWRVAYPAMQFKPLAYWSIIIGGANLSVATGHGGVIVPGYGTTGDNYRSNYWTLRMDQQSGGGYTLPSGNIHTIGEAVVGHHHRLETEWILGTNNGEDFNGTLRTWLHDFATGVTTSRESNDVQFRLPGNPLSGFFRRHIDPIWGGRGGGSLLYEQHLRYRLSFCAWKDQMT